jgi:Uma2 family endonuclease
MSMPEIVLGRPMTVAEFLRFEEGSPARHEYVAGEVHAMSGASARHHRIMANVFTRLFSVARGGPCQAFMVDMLLRAAEDLLYYPDVMVVCGPVDGEDRVVHDPCVVIEVTSPSTAVIDRREKLAAYRRIASLRAYLIVDQSRRRVERHWRDTNGEWWREQVPAAGRVPVPCLDIELTVDEIYDGVELAAVSEAEAIEYEP